VSVLTVGWRFGQFGVNLYQDIPQLVLDRTVVHAVSNRLHFQLMLHLRARLEKLLPASGRPWFEQFSKAAAQRCVGIAASGHDPQARGKNSGQADI